MGDLDGDGDDDAIILNHYDHQVYWISFENGEPSINSELISTRLEPQFGATHDLDGDGVEELFVTHDQGERGLWCYTRNHELQQWEAEQIFPQECSNEIEILQIGDVTYVFGRINASIYFNVFDGDWQFGGGWGPNYFQLEGLGAFHVDYVEVCFAYTPAHPQGFKCGKARASRVGRTRPMLKAYHR